MACCRALALRLLPASAHFRARINFRRRLRCCAAAGDQVEAPQDAVLKAISLSTPFWPKSGRDGRLSLAPVSSTLRWIFLTVAGGSVECSEVATSKGRIAQTTNVIMGGTVTDDTTDEWLVLDKRVNIYPTVRGFTAIGTGGDDFVQSMVVAVESVIEERIPEGQISQKVSAKGKYVSVKIGPIRVVSKEQVQAVYNAMRKDKRMKFFL